MAGNTVEAIVDGYVTIINADGDEITTTFRGRDTVEIVASGKKGVVTALLIASGRTRGKMSVASASA